MITTTLATELRSFEAYVSSRRADIDKALERALPAPPVCPKRVAAAMRYGVTGGGKRIRPLLTLAAAETVALAQCGDDESALGAARQLAMPAACAVEFIHCYSLIHDDLPAMDDSPLRRGRPTVHVVFGEAIAILAGDGLLAEAFALLANEPNDCGAAHIADRKLRVLKRVGAALGSAGMLGGQAMDLAGEAFDAAPIKDMHARKTGSLIRAASVAGAIMAGGTPAQIAAIDRFAAELGLAFQIVDDIIDVEGSEASAGKCVGRDRAQNKVTYPLLFGLERSRQLAAACADRARQALWSAGLAPHCLGPLATWTLSRTH